MSRENIIQKFNSHFDGEPQIFKAPGRVNLIGEHTDYNDGFVFPMAIDFYTTVAISKRDDRILEIWSENMNESITIQLDDNTKKRDHWSDYVSGVAAILEKDGHKFPGANIYLESNVPVGAGLSSSAALEISSALALLSTTNDEIETEELALVGQRAENQFVGMNCGIMDQFISVHGKEDKALFLDCRSLDYELVPLPSDKIQIVICNTMVKHELGSSEYNKRRAECEEGVRIMQHNFPSIKALRDLSSEDFAVVECNLSKIVRNRCRHVITECERTEASVAALKAGDLEKFGQLMNESHDSLRDDYEVSCKELDIMVDIAREIPGTLGARMTGGGFGGCTVNLVEIDKTEAFCDEIKNRYKEATGKDPDIIVSSPSEGAHKFA